MFTPPPNTAFSVSLVGDRKVLYDHRSGKMYTSDPKVPDQAFVQNVIKLTKAAQKDTRISKFAALALASIPDLTNEDVQSRLKAMVEKYQKKENVDLSHMKVELSEKEVERDGSVNNDMPVKEHKGSWSSNNTIYINPKLKDALAHYSGNDSIGSLVAYLKEVDHTVAHELAHEVWENKKYEGFKERIAREVKEHPYHTDYLASYAKDDPEYGKEAFCEYLAHKIS